MLKYVDVAVTFSEIPDEISLCINISNCPCHCKGCHSPYLAQDIGNLLTKESIETLLEHNNGISCFVFMGGDLEPNLVNEAAKYIKGKHHLKTAWYSGRDEISKYIEISNFDYIKIGSYNENLGPLNSDTTNQKFYKIGYKNGEPYTIDETYKFKKQIVK